MELVTKIILICSFSFLFNIIVPGYYLATLINKLRSNETKSNNYTLETFLQGSALGVFFSSLIFLVITILLHFTNIPQNVLVGANYVICIGMLILLIKQLKQDSFIITSEVLSFFKKPINLLIVTLSVFFGIYAIYAFPHSFDVGQLYWTRAVIFGDINQTVLTSFGNFAYSSLIYLPSYIFKNLPLVTLVAGFKLSLSFMLGLVVIYIVPKISKHEITKLLYYTILILSFFGFYGFMETGKDSIWGCIFAILFFAKLIDLKNENFDFFVAGLYFICAVSLGVINAPYLSLITVLFMIFSLGELKKPFNFLLILAAVAGLGYAIAISAMLKFSIYPLLVILAILILVLYILRNYEITSKPLFKDNGWIISYLPIILILLLMLASSLLMPFAAPIKNSSDPVKEIIHYFTPFDGKMKYLEYLFSFANLNSENWVIRLGFIGILLLPLSKNYRNNKMLISLAIFSFLFLFALLVIGRLPHSPFSGINLWDMSRDLRNWYGPIIFGLFLIIGLEIIAKKWNKIIPLKNIMLILSVSLISVFLFLSFHDLKRLLNHQTYFTSTSGDKDKYLAELTGYLNSLDNSIPLYLSYDAKGSNYLFILPLFTGGRAYPIDIKNNQFLSSIILPAYILINENELNRLRQDKQLKVLKIKNLHNFDDSKESINFISK